METLAVRSIYVLRSCATVASREEKNETSVKLLTSAARASLKNVVASVLRGVWEASRMWGSQYVTFRAPGSHAWREGLIRRGFGALVVDGTRSCDKLGARR